MISVMTNLPSPQPASPTLRPVSHPELSSALTHFCDRWRPSGYAVPERIKNMSGRQRLEEILWEDALTAFVTFSGGAPAVCMTEAGVAGLQYLIGSKYYAPWGLVFDRQSVYNAGGGPVWYARNDEYNKLDPALRHWAVRYGPDSDWIEEREWRVPRDPRGDRKDPTIPLDELGLLAVIVGDSDWYALRPFTDLDEIQGHFYPPWAFLDLPRWWWNAEIGELVELPPLATTV